MIFSVEFLRTLLYVALGLIAIGAGTLLVLVVIDLKERRLW